jgi:hypothetical protein
LVCGGSLLAGALAREAGLPALQIEDSQFGAKVGLHAQDLGLSPADAADRSTFQHIINNIWGNPDEVRQGPWNPAGEGGSNYLFARQGNNVVVATSKGQFVTILQGGINNGWFRGATTKWP